MFGMDEFSGKVAVVTGGSDGLGKDFCRALASAECHVYFCARNAARGDAVQAELGPFAHFVAADLGEPAQVQAFADLVRAEAGHVDFLINNVAVDDRIKFEDLTLEECDRMWNINTRSYLLTTHAFLGMLRAGSGKAIVNVGTTNFMVGLEPFTLYNATKSAILGFTRSLAREFGRDGIRVNMLSPGWIMTEKQLREHVTEQDREELIEIQALKRLMLPEDVTPAALFLLSSAACGVTGQNLVIDGGRVMA